MYFQNRTDVFKIILQQLTNNSNFNSQIVGKKDNCLIVLSQNNGYGKSALLLMLPYFIQKVDYRGIDQDVYYPEISIYKKETITVLEAFIRIILTGISQLLFGENKNLKQINYTFDHLEYIKRDLNVFLSESENEIKQNAYINLIEYYDLKQIPEYKVSNFKRIIFRIDEIGNITTIPKYLNLSEKRYEDIVNYHKNRNFQFPFKYMRLYLLRNYIEDFRSEFIDFVIAGKNSFQPYMGKMQFNQSPSLILFINLSPMKENDRHIKNIFIYHLMITNPTKSKLKTYLLEIKTKFDNDSEKFNKIIDHFCVLIEKYTGGHPRMIFTLLTYFDNSDIKFSDYFESFDEIQIEKLFFNIRKELFLQLEENVFSRFAKDNELLISINRVLKEKTNLSESIIYHIFFNREDPLAIIQILSNICLIYNNTEIKLLSLNEMREKILLSPRDIIDSIGLQYHDKYNILRLHHDKLIESNDSVEIDHLKALKIFFSQYLIMYLLKDIKNEKQLIDILTLQSLFPFKISGTQMQDILIKFYFFSFRFNIKKVIISLLKDNNDNDLVYCGIQEEIINGYKTDIKEEKKSKSQIFNEKNSEYAKQITSQIMNLKSFNNNNRTLLIKPTLENNYAHDFFILTPNIKNSNRKLLCIQITTANKRPNKNSDIVKYYSSSDGYKIEKGYHSCLAIQNIIPDIEVKYIFISIVEEKNLSFVKMINNQTYQMYQNNQESYQKDQENLNDEKNKLYLAVPEDQVTFIQSELLLKLMQMNEYKN